MGGVVETMGKGLASSLQELSGRKSTASSYQQMADEQAYEAALTAANAQRQNEYLLQTAQERIQKMYQNYQQALGSQRASLAAAGVRNDSATAQQLLKNNRFQALLEEQAVVKNLQTNVYENNIQAAEKIRTLQNSAQAYRRAASSGSSWWKWGRSLLSLFAGR